MKNSYAQMSPEQLQEHRLEIENRIRNLFWTMSGDYSLDVKPDVRTFAKSPDIALYDAMKQGAFAKYFNQDALALYMMKKMHLSARKQPLFELVQLCIDAAAYPRMKKERKGIDEIRTQAFADLFRLVPVNAELSLFGKVRMYSMRRFLETCYLKKDILKENSLDESALKAAFLDERKPQEMKSVETIADKINALGQAESTDEIIGTIDELYNTYYDTRFEQEHGNLQQVLHIKNSVLIQAAYEDFLTDQQMDKILDKFLKQQGMNAFSLQMDATPGKKRKRPKASQKFNQDAENARDKWKEDVTSMGGKSREELAEEAKRKEEAARKAYAYIELNYGKSYLTSLERERKNRMFCRGIHRGCKLHYTDGILQAPAKKNYRYRMSQLQFEKNKQYYFMNHRVIKRNIVILAEALEKALALRNQASITRARSGQLIPSRLWKLNRTKDDKLFNRTEKVSNSDFVVDILLDSSGSQLNRQPQVAAQGYIIGEALTQAGIPHRVISYCTFLDYTVLHRFHEYEENTKQDMRIFEFNASANNRDGLAVKAAYDSLVAREEEHKILIILSDGRPSDVVRRYEGMTEIQPYFEEEAIRDTAFEVRRARALGISVLGIFAGAEEDLMAEKKMFGKDFAYIRNISNFSHVVGTYLRRQIDGED